jgi:RNA polymerase sigma-70 factor, ECF subfamily
MPNAATSSHSLAAAMLTQRADVDVRARLDRFFRETERRAFKIALISLKNTDEALDAVQDAMYNFVRSYSEKPAADWPKLFYTVLDSRLTDWHRRNTVRRRFFGLLPAMVDQGADMLDAVADLHCFDPSVLRSGTETGAAIESALQKLPERQRQAFLLRLWEGFDVAQTAEIMRCGEGSVKTHLSRALNALRLKLSDHHDSY